ncbi:MAG TPA: hypothetical protein VHU91_01515 [Mycobacteriales bacterium]|nr:hypothetical protein [Mycobacteriales bacterium]
MTEVKIDVDQLAELRRFYDSSWKASLELTIELSRIGRGSAEIVSRRMTERLGNGRMGPSRGDLLACQATDQLASVNRRITFVALPLLLTLRNRVDDQLRELEAVANPNLRRGTNPLFAGLENLLWAGPGSYLTRLIGLWAAGKVGYQGPAYAAATPAVASPVPLNLGGLLARLGTLKDGQVEVLRVGGGTSDRYVVLIRGVASLTGPSPNSMIDAIRGQAFGSSAHSSGVLSAMRKAGIPPGSEVMLVGHSQGGITAMNLAADPRVNAFAGGLGYVRIVDVVAAGSPIDGKRIPAETRLLAMHNLGDVIPALDGRDDRRSVNRLVYTFGRPGALNLAAAHGITSSYAPEARSDRFLNDTQVRSFIGASDMFLRQPVESAQRFSLHRGLEPDPRRAVRLRVLGIGVG